MDSILDLVYTNNIFTVKPDWGTDPHRDFLFDREFVQYAGGKPGIQDYDVGTTRRLSFSFSMLDNEERYAIEDFFTQQKGRAKRFWCPLWGNLFVIQADIPQWSDKVRINYCGFNTAFTPTRYFLYIELNDGSRITRSISSVTNHTSYEELTVASVFDQAIDIDDIAYCTLILLCRFEQDELTITHESADACSTSLNLIELIDEYELSEES